MANDNKYEFLEHTGDAKYKAYGSSIEERFANAAQAMFSLIIDRGDIKPAEKKEIEVSGTDLKQLLYNWLEELLFLLDADSFFFREVESINIEEKGRLHVLKATIVGDTFKEDYLVFGSVKAVTYAEMEINPDHVQVVVDI